MKKKYIYGILTIFWICIIFSFSLQPAEQSLQLSDGVGMLILKYILSELFEVSASWTEVEWSIFGTVIRKCAHFTEYFVLGILMMMTVKHTNITRKCLIGFVMCVLVASMDETIQLFVPGRAGMVTDVMLDSVGSLTGLMSCVLCMKIILKYRE